MTYSPDSRRCVATLVACGAVLASLTMVGGCQALDPIAGRGRKKPPTVSPQFSGLPPAVSTARPRPVGVAGDEQARRGSILAGEGKLDAALVEFEKAIATNPRLTVAYLGAGDIYRQQGDYTKAEQRYGTAAQLEPNRFDAQYLHGLSLQLLDRLSESVRAYLRALSIRPDDFNANLNLATAYMQLNEPSQGLAYAQRAVALKGDDAAARTNLGAIYASVNRHEEAIVEYQQAAELSQLSGRLLLNLADSLFKVGRYEEMVNTLEQLTRTEPTANAYERLGTGLFSMRRYPESLGAFRKALEIDPNHYPALNGVGVNLLNQWVYSQQTDQPARQEGIKSLRRSLQVERNQPYILELVARYQ